MKKREIIWDIIKGIGIISIVIGHVTPNKPIHEFVYLYHLAIFYFIATYFYNEEKWGDNPYGNIGNRIKSVWIKYMFYSIILITLHNFFIKYNFYNPNTQLFVKFEDYIVPVLNCITFNTSELFSGALWFIPTIIVSTSLFGGIVYISRKLSTTVFQKLKRYIKTEKNIKYLLIIVFSILYGWLGVYLNINKLKLIYHIHTSFLVIPVCALGYFFREYRAKIKKIDKLYIITPVFIISTSLLFFIVLRTNMQIELASEKIINPIMFYIVTFIGILFCLSFAKIIEKIPLLNIFFELCGRHSFSIMALHFAGVKLVDVVYSKFVNETNPEVISKFVTSYPGKIWLIYLFVGCVIPLLFSIIIEFIKNILKKVNDERNKI